MYIINHTDIYELHIYVSSVCGVCVYVLQIVQQFWEFPHTLWLGVSAFIANDLGSVPGWTTKILQA